MPIFMPFTPRSSPAVYEGTGSSALAGSSGSWPASTSSASALSPTVRVIGPIWSIDHESGTTPARLTRP